jgi:hypothetical protein
MGALHSVYGADLPKSLWNGDVLHLPQPLLDEYSAKLDDKGWLANHHAGKEAACPVGGASNEESERHFTYRFLSSAARMAFICADPKDGQPDIRDAVLDQLAEAKVLSDLLPSLSFKRCSASKFFTPLGVKRGTKNSSRRYQF